MTNADALLLQMVEAEQQAPQQQTFIRQRSGSRDVLFHPGWTDPPVWDSIELALLDLLQQKLVHYGPKRSYVISETGHERYSRLTRSLRQKRP